MPLIDSVNVAIKLIVVWTFCLDFLFGLCLDFVWELFERCSENQN